MSNILRIACGNGNCYLIFNGKDAILVDTCRKKYQQKVLDACEPFQLRLLVLTHGHLDHMENAAFLSRSFNIPIAMHRADLDLLKDNLNQSLSAHSILGKIVLAAVDQINAPKRRGFTPPRFVSFSYCLKPHLSP